MTLTITTQPCEVKKGSVLSASSWPPGGDCCLRAKPTTETDCRIDWVRKNVVWAEEFMRAISGITVLLVAILLSAPVQAFDCSTLNFGAKFSDLDDGNFVLYQKKEGVTYYNYTGPCRLEVHRRACPAIAYAFVDGVYYARIIRVQGRPKNEVLKDFETAFGAPDKTKRMGSTTEYINKMPNGTTIKLKYDDKTGVARSATYDNAVRDKLRGFIGEDPAELPAN